MPDFSEQLRARLGMNRPATPTGVTAGRFNRTTRPALAATPVRVEEENQVFVFDQYDGSSLGFYVEIEAPTLAEAQARLKDLVSEQDVIQVPLGVYKGTAITGRITFHPSGVRPTYFRARRRPW